jgi:hypothetical protein
LVAWPKPWTAAGVATARDMTDTERRAFRRKGR